VSARWTAAGAAVLLAVALSAAAASGRLLPGELRLARAWQETPGGSALEPAADWLALPAVEYGVVAAAVLVATARRDGALAFAALLALAAASLNAEFKDLIGRPRPLPSQLEVREPAPGLGFPSGHAMSAALFYGYAGAVAWARLPRVAALAAVCACTAAAALIGWDRVDDGAHWPTDVAGGYVIGAIMLALAVGAARLSAALLHRLAGGRR
jgi:undecaprenyl-diphosphatase